jgi:precorrin-6Y C5,15-methyltransferase (decarboxylating)
VPSRIVVVGVSAEGDDGLGPAARAALAGADLVVGAPRHLAAAPPQVRALALGADLDGALGAIAGEPGVVCVLASGDPGFFGIVRPLAARFGRERLEVHPAPSSVSLAFARLGLPWDDAVVVSAHGRPLPEAAGRAGGHPKVAVLTSPSSPPELLGKELLALGAKHTTVAVCARLGLVDERVEVTDLGGLAAGTWDPLSVVVLLAGTGVPAGKSLSWGLPEAAFEHRAGMVTKAEVRAVALGKLDLPGAGVLWDVGAGSGSVAVECARLAPGLRVVAIERRADDAERIAANAAAHDVALTVVRGEAPAALGGLPDPDRAFIGGGGLDVLDAVLTRLRPGGRVVATHAALDRAAASAARLGHLVQVAVSRGERLPDGGLRLAAANPVFITWGPNGSDR